MQLIREQTENEEIRKRTVGFSHFPSFHVINAQGKATHQSTHKVLHTVTESAPLVAQLYVDVYRPLVSIRLVYPPLNSGSAPIHTK
jgi:hypothetical protein